MDNNQNNFQSENKPTKKDSNIGPIIGSVIIIVLIILGGLYFWGYIINKQQVNAPTTEESEVEEVKTEEIADPDVAEINNELNSTNVDEIDSELNKIDAEFDASVQ